MSNILASKEQLVEQLLLQGRAIEKLKSERASLKWYSSFTDEQLRLTQDALGRSHGQVLAQAEQLRFADTVCTELVGIVFEQAEELDARPVVYVAATSLNAGVMCYVVGPM